MTATRFASVGLRMRLAHAALVALALLTFTGPLAAQTNVFPSSGNVGIGTTSPTAKLHVAGSGFVQLNPDDGSLELASGNDYYSYIDFRGSSNLGSDFRGRFGYGDGVGFDLTGPGGLMLMRLTETGNVGIGTANPASKLEIYSGSGANSLALKRATIGQDNLLMFWDASDLKFWMGSPSWQDSGTGFGLFNDDRAKWVFRVNPSSDDLYLAPGGGNVGIGTTSPSQSFEVQGTGIVVRGNNSSGTEYTDWPTSSIAIRRSDDFTLNGVTMLTLGYRNDPLYLTDDSVANIRLFDPTQSANTATSGTGTQLRIASPGSVILQAGNGNVGIGTTNPTQKLSVNGTIQAKEVVVQTGWADYVFDDNYHLAPLSEVESHIKTQKHLPGIPSAAEVAERGVSMGEMQTKLLAKIEELTLHQIAQEKRSERLEAENARLQQKLAELEKRFLP